MRVKTRICPKDNPHCPVYYHRAEWANYVEMNLVLGLGTVVIIPLAYIIADVIEYCLD